MILLFGLILVGFVLGVTTVVAVEGLGVWLIIKRLSTKMKRDEAKISSKSEVRGGELDHQQSLSFAFNKQGVVWVLEPEKISKLWQEKPSREQRRRKELFEVSPVKKYGKIKDQSLILTEPDSFHITTIQLKGCIVVAVSASTLSSRKWAKKFPIKLESNTSVIYNGSKTLHIYLETSWEKEAWCKALRLASCDITERVNWFARMNEEFHSYLTSLNSEYHSFLKPSVGYNVDSIDRPSEADAASSKVRQFWRKFSRKTSRVGSDTKSSCASLSGRKERKSIDKLRAAQDVVLATGLMKNASTAKPPKCPMEDNGAPLPSALSRSASQNSHTSANSDADLDEKFGIDEGTLCWNLLISRLFFDAIGNAQVKGSIQARIQRTLSNMRTPSYVGEVICTDISIGNFPPFIVGMRVLPMEMTEVWAFEVDIVYSGGAIIEIETRLEVCEQDLPRGMEDLNPKSSKAGKDSSDLLEGFDYIGKQLNLAEGTSVVKEVKEDDSSKSFRNPASSPASGSRWKSMVNSIAKQVSQVPLSLAIRVASLKGTLRLHIKPPPSDQLWYGFTSMPDIDFNLESAVGDHKITSAHIVLFLVNRLKAAIRETMVLPNCENVCIPWMLAEKDDWVPRNIAPFIWANQESGIETNPVSFEPPGEGKAMVEASARTSNDGSQHKQLKSNSVVYGEEPTWNPSDSTAQPSSSSGTLRTSRSSKEMKMPLLQNDVPRESRDREPRAISLQNEELQETSELNMESFSECESPPRNDVLLDKQNSCRELDDTRQKKMEKKGKMHELRRRMSEKFEEKKRHIVEKMRAT